MLISASGIKRLNRKIKRRTKAVVSFPDDKAPTMPAAARHKFIANDKWSSRKHLDVGPLDSCDERRDTWA